MTATIRIPERQDRCESCGRPIRWAVSAASGRPIPLDPDPVEPRSRGALVLIGERAFGRVAAVDRLRVMFSLNDADADHAAANDYLWHVAHFATCPKAHMHRRPRARR